MSYIKAYSDENLRHADLFKLQCPDNLVESRLKELCQYFTTKFVYPVKPLSVKFTKEGGAHFRHRGLVEALEFNFTPGKTSLLTLAHEFAHYLDWLQKSQQYRLLRTKRDLARGSTVINYADQMRSLWRQRSHGASHSAMVDRAVAAVKELGWHHGADEIPGWNLNVERATIAAKTAPSESSAWKSEERWTEGTLWCPKCRQYVPKDRVGFRVVSRNPLGEPTRVIRQSYCRPCRSTKKQ